MSPYKDIAQLLTRFPTLYILYPWLIYLAAGSLCLLISLTYFSLPPLPTSPLATTCLFSASVTLFLFYVCLLTCVFFLKIQHISEIIQFLSFSVWLISLSIIPYRSIHVVRNGKISFFLWLSSIPFYIVVLILVFWGF